ncbi:MAG: hypothetical protein LBD31_04390 [Treponema sp.]|jgi:CRP-like cAMP-binding protein|nr:hypothetical protein [Treponema sp.]
MPGAVEHHRAKAGVSALALPPRLFDEILRCDTGMDRSIIEHLSRRLKTGNERLASRDSFGMDAVPEDDFPESTTPP